MIDEFQSVFIPGCMIIYNVLLSFESMHWIRKYQGGKTRYMAIELDISKVYDRVE